MNADPLNRRSFKVIKEKSTLLVLGAGASWDFGFPLGRGLLVKVCTLLAQARIAESRISRALQGLGLTLPHLQEFREELIKSANTSVDAFLERQPKFMEAGKAAMAGVLLPAERKSGPRLFDQAKNHWYKYLLNRLRSELDQFGENRLSIVTFNYDRSLEHFFVTAVQHSYGLSPEQSQQVTSQIPIVHIYGKLGDMSAVSYGAAPDDMVLRTCVETIHVVSDDAASEAPTVQDAQRLVREADRVYFLGFGYHPTNLERLGIPGKIGEGKDIRGSVYDFTKKEVSEIRLLIGHGFRAGHRDWDCLGWLRNDAELS